MSDTELLNKAIDSAKNFANFQDVLMAVSLHPEWLTFIPEDRKWAILHQIILSGDVAQLDQLLALQKTNKQFYLLTKTRDNYTVLDIASLREDKPDMTKRIQQLIKLDEMLNYAKNCQWDQCYAIAKENPSFVNEKPPYRRFYLIHHMACANAIEEFERFKKIKNCIFAINLRADRKKMNVIAREEDQLEFAAYIEQQYPSLLDEDDSVLDEVCKPSEEAIEQTNIINTVMEHKAVVRDLDQNLMGKSPQQKNRGEVIKHINAMQSERGKEQKSAGATSLETEDNKRKETILDTLTCPLTLAVFTEPVIAADGVTYERSAIKKWLERNDKSPMTNQPLPNKELNPNHVVKQIIQALQFQV